MDKIDPQHKLDRKIDETTSKCHTFLGILGCLGGLFIQLVIGSLYQWGIINIYITSYYRALDPNITLQSNAIAFPIMMFCIGLTMRLGLFLAEHTHPLIVLGINQVLSALVIFIASYVKTMFLFLVFYGILFGLIAGLSFMIPIVECNKYFPGKKMYVNGFILIGTGMGSVVFGLFSYSFLNPNKIAPLQGYYEGSLKTQQIAAQVPALLKWLSLLYLAIGLSGVAFITPVCLQNRRKENQAAYRLQKHHQKYLTKGANKQLKREIQFKPHEANGVRQAFCSLICWIEVIILILGSCGCFLVNGNYKTYVRDSISDDQFLTIIGVVASVGNGCTRFFWNLLFSRTGYKTVTLINLFIMIAVFSTVRFTVNSKGIYMLEVFLANACIGGYLVTTPTFCQALFGQKTGSNIYGFYWTVFAIANFIQYFYVQYLSVNISFDNVIYICLGMCILAIPFVIFTKFQGPWQNETIVLEYCISHQIAKREQFLEKKEKQEKQNQLQRNKYYINLKISKHPIPQLQDSINELKNQENKEEQIKKEQHI